MKGGLAGAVTLTGLFLGRGERLVGNFEAFRSDERGRRKGLVVERLVGIFEAFRSNESGRRKGLIYFLRL